MTSSTAGPGMPGLIRLDGRSKSKQQQQGQQCTQMSMITLRGKSLQTASSSQDLQKTGRKGMAFSSRKALQTASSSQAQQASGRIRSRKALQRAAFETSQYGHSLQSAGRRRCVSKLGKKEEASSVKGVPSTKLQVQLMQSTLSKLQQAAASVQDSILNKTSSVQKSVIDQKSIFDGYTGGHPEEDSVGGGFLSRKLLGKVVGTVGAMALLLGSWGFGGMGNEALAGETLTIMLPSSQNQDVTRVQRTLVETWGIVREAFFDPTFNHQDWDTKLQEAVRQSLQVENGEQAYETIKSMLSSLDDPFTRIVTPREYENFRITSDGGLEGVGLILASDPESGQLMVIAPVEGGPADRAGIQSGDTLLEIDHLGLSGMDPQDAAKMLRGGAGTSVLLKLQHTSPLSASVPGGIKVPPVIEEVELQREAITFSPVYATLLPHTTNDGNVTNTGYIRLASFSQNAAQDMQRAVEKLERQGASSFILDLRNNPGGLVKAGLDVAQMWLEGTSTLVNTVDRFGGIQTISAQDDNLHALTQKPLAVLVNHGSASASEILAGALQDNKRATLVGETTYGKGRIQSVFELTDGTALFVTVAKYLSPSLHEIDRVGVAPDMTCSLPGLTLTASSSRGSTVVPSTGVESEAALKESSLGPEDRTSLVPIVDDGSGYASVTPPSIAEVSPLRPFRSLIEEIQDDTCVIAAERQLDASPQI